MEFMLVISGWYFYIVSKTYQVPYGKDMERPQAIYGLNVRDVAQKVVEHKMGST